jgi:ABC transporter
MTILGCLDTPTAGRYLLEGRDVSSLDDDELSGIRHRRIGFVFQQFNLLPRLTAQANVEMPLLYGAVSGRERRERAQRKLEVVGLESRAAHRPAQLSGGEQQCAASRPSRPRRPSGGERPQWPSSFRASSGPFSQTTSSTPMRLSPAIQPEATGKVNSSDHRGYFFSPHQPSAPPRKKSSP